MLNRNKALTNFIVGYVTSLLMVILFVVLGSTHNSWIGNNTGTNTSTLSGIAFGISFFVVLIAYVGLTLAFSTPENFKKAPLAIFLSALLMSLAIAFSVFVFDYTINEANLKLISEIIMIILFSISIVGLLWFMQEFNTKFTMSSISSNRADEWEYTNFLDLSFNKIGVEHKNGHTELTYKGNVTLITFIPEDVIERKIFLSGDMKTKAISDLESKIQGDQKAALVFLSNTLPHVDGSVDKVAVIKNSDIFSFVKGRSDEK